MPFGCIIYQLYKKKKLTRVKSSVDVFLPENLFVWICFVKELLNIKI